MSAFSRYRVAPEPPQTPQLSLREEVAIYKAKRRAISTARKAALASNNVCKPKKSYVKPQKRNIQCFKRMRNHFKCVYNDMFSNFKRKSYICIGFFCCMSSEVRVFVNEEFPASHVPVV